MIQKPTKGHYAQSVFKFIYAFPRQISRQIASNDSKLATCLRSLSSLNWRRRTLDDSDRQSMELGGALDAENDKSCRQNVIVMRHGHRLDNFDSSWISTAERPWDPPLAKQGRKRAFETGRQLRNELGFPIHRVFVSPFLRCIETASAVVSALCAVGDDPVNAATGDGVSIDPSRIKVSIEYGLCEMLNVEAIRIISVPKDGIWGFNISELEDMLPAGTVDHTVERLYPEMPKWGETIAGARTRYETVIRALADNYPSENLLLVTHGEGVGVAFSAFWKDVTVYEVEYCAYSQSVRSIQFDENQSFTAGTFEVVPNQTGIGYCTLSPY